MYEIGNNNKFQPSHYRRDARIINTIFLCIIATIKEQFSLLPLNLLRADMLFVAVSISLILQVVISDWSSFESVFCANNKLVVSGVK